MRRFQSVVPVILVVAMVVVLAGCSNNEDSAPPVPRQMRTFNEQDFLQNTYFWLTCADSTGRAGDPAGTRHRIANYRENYRHFTQNMDQMAVPVAYWIDSLQVYVETSGAGSAPLWGWAYAMPYLRDLPRGDSIPQDGDHVSNFWRRLTPETDYSVDTQLGYVHLKQPANGRLACAFSTRGGIGYDQLMAPADTFGVLAGADPADLRLLLLKNSNPDSTMSTWDLMFRNVYSLQDQGLDKSNFALNIYRMSPFHAGAEVGPQGSNTTYLTFFGFDLTGPGGAGGPDNMVDDNPVIIDWSRGVLRFLDLTPFAPSGIYIGNSVEPTVIGDLWALHDAARAAGDADSSAYLASYLYRQKTTQFSVHPTFWKFVAEHEIRNY